LRRLVAAICAVALASGPALGQEGEPPAGNENDGPSEGDAPDVVAPPAPEVQARVGVIVLGEDGEPLPSATRATLQVTMERALEDDERLEIVDADTELARRAGLVPTDLVSEARGLLSAGEELLRRGRTDPAMAKLEAASDHLAEVLAWTSKQELAKAQFLLGAAHAIRGDKKDAITAFTALLAWRPDYTADPSISPKDVLPLWDKAEAKVKRLEGGSIEIASRPDGAMAYVDGRFVGFTPTVVEGLPTAVHYVTVRLHGRVRSVSAVKVSEKHPSQVEVTLERTAGVDELEAAIEGVQAGIGQPQVPAAVQASFGDIAALLEVQQAVVVVVPSGAGPYRGYVYNVEGGTLLASAAVELGERDPEEAFAELGKALYDQVSFEPPPPPPPDDKVIVKTGTPVWKRWWFWGTVGTAVAVGIAVPLFLGRDTAPELACPAGQSCGVVILSF
jgi:tetratricopeptide (TPR) repeat protein